MVVQVDLLHGRVRLIQAVVRPIGHLEGVALKHGLEVGDLKVRQLFHPALTDDRPAVQEDVDQNIPRTGDVHRLPC